ncbi:RagB/SusD family nutrient uptake outer membrane protein [Chitinophaga agrisoli]|uniref:RagB/SusD family nutrient uptake outer membrane protein n=1 Tax=Chitinophaga agrisoli TaxID=2607653 RepID=A0A5B2VRC1_9BACT|nr:RagB/SusD family nutrient uptake outer membrane protein [Chitinophaga agrisoli]KAA2240782.1 RagB/SusD family nutrient uptake outer membrane protein [Chitinophaga agrisoli]
MNTHKYIIPLLGTVLLFSCKKFLDVAPRDAVSDETAAVITDGTSAANAVRGLYRGIAADGYYGTTFQAIGYLSGDNIVWTGSQSIVQQFISHNVRADNASIATAWSAIYAVINRANHIITEVPTVTDPSLTPALKNQYTGEGYFARALGYFDLARTWGGVQITLTPTVTAQDKYGIKRSTLQQTYAQVLSDLVAADSLLPETTNRVRATRKTVWALRARYHLYRQEWANAVTYASKLIDDPSYTLLSPYSAWFANNVTGTAESVFEMSYSTTYPNTHRNSWQPPANNGTRQWAPNDAFLALVNDPTIGGSRSALVAKTSAGLWYGNLYYRPNPATDPSYVIRIAELYLIRAEARAQLNDLNGALSDLDAVRTRAGLGHSEAATKENILLAIENERRLEFAFEPHRWFDLVRTGRAAAVLNVTNPDRLLMPVPASEVLNDKDLDQNHGY